MNSLHENACFSLVSEFRGVPPHLGHLPGLLLASCWLPSCLLLASCWRLAGLLLVSCCPLPGFLPASWLLASFKLPYEDFFRKSVSQRVPKTGEFSSCKATLQNTRQRNVALTSDHNKTAPLEARSGRFRMQNDAVKIQEKAPLIGGWG